MENPMINDMFKGLPYTNGGIEIWIQYGFEYAIKKAMEIPVQTKIPFREKKTYENTAQFADWVFTPNMDPRNSISTKGLIVELKVQSSTIGGTKFADLVLADQKKISAGRQADYKSYDTAVLAIAWDPSAGQALEKINMTPVRDIEIVLVDRRVIKLYEWTEAPTATGSPPSVGNQQTPPPPLKLGT